MNYKLSFEPNKFCSFYLPFCFDNEIIEFETRKFKYCILKTKYNMIDIYIPSNEIQKLHLSLILNKNKELLALIFDDRVIKRWGEKSWMPEILSRTSIDKALKIDRKYCLITKCIFKNWKNLSFPLRKMRVSMVSNMLTLITSSVIKCEVLTNEIIDNKHNDKLFTYAVCSNDKINFNFEGKLNIGYQNFKIVDEWLHALIKLNEKDFKIDCQATTSIERLDEEKFPPIQLPICGSDILSKCENKDSFFVIFKPNGYLWITRFFELLKRPFLIENVFVLEADKNENYIRFFYPSCENRPYGQEWFSYLEQRPLLFVKFQTTNLSFSELNEIKTVARNESQFIWTKNIMHGAENKEEQELMIYFFNKMKNFKPIINDEEHDELIKKIDATHKPDVSNTIEYYLS